jgi:small-conductance mechanosensitive channel
MHIQPILYIVYGAAWIAWLVALRAPVRQQKEQQQQHHVHNHSDSLKCAQVRPLLATFLYILAWVFLVCMVIALCCMPWINCSDPRVAAACSGGGILFMILLIGIFALQIRYIDEIRRSGRTVKEDCTPKNRYVHSVVYAFAIFIFVIGLVGLLVLSAVLDAKSDMATMLALQKQGPAIRSRLLKRVSGQ